MTSFISSRWRCKKIPIFKKYRDFHIRKITISSKKTVLYRLKKRHDPTMHINVILIASLSLFPSVIFTEDKIIVNKHNYNQYIKSCKCEQIPCILYDLLPTGERNYILRDLFEYKCHETCPTLRTIFETKECTWKETYPGNCEVTDYAYYSMYDYGENEETCDLSENLKQVPYGYDGWNDEHTIDHLTKSFIHDILCKLYEGDTWCDSERDYWPNLCKQKHDTLVDFDKKQSIDQAKSFDNEQFIDDDQTFNHLSNEEYIQYGVLGILLCSLAVFIYDEILYQTHKRAEKLLRKKKEQHLDVREMRQSDEK